MFDRVLAVHALEEADDPAAVLAEIGRVMAPTGRLIVAVASRDGVWAGAESTPFGHGRPFSRSQLERLIRDAELEPAGWTRALYAPPLPMAAGWAEGFEQVGARLWPRFAGLILMEAVKQTFAVKPRGHRARVRVFAPGVLAPSPAGPAPARKAPVRKAPARVED
jgi:SAM-dependent methyltransferase